jgi:sulfur relay (sulfurtransferase) DsrF/TusC family protein
MSKLYIHCGVHKTGTTSLQAYCSEFADYLLTNNILYPKSSRQLGWGQHNLALGLTRDRRFIRSCGDLQTIREEVGDFRGHILLSSEAFQFGFEEPECLLPLIDFARETNRDVVFICYIRNQHDFLLSLYPEILKHGYSLEFKEALKTVLSTGVIRSLEQNFQFDYDLVLQKLKQIKGTEVVLRNYEKLEGGSTVTDFFSFLKLKIPNREALTLRMNPRACTESSLTLFYQKRVDRPLSEWENAVLVHLGKLKGEVRLSPQTQASLARHFYASNQRLPWPPEDIAAFQARLSSKVAKCARGIPFDAEKFYSFETQCLINEGAYELAKTQDAAAVLKEIHNSALTLWRMPAKPSLTWSIFRRLWSTPTPSARAA